MVSGRMVRGMIRDPWAGPLGLWLTTREVCQALRRHTCDRRSLWLAVAKADELDSCGPLGGPYGRAVANHAPMLSSSCCRLVVLATLLAWVMYNGNPVSHLLTSIEALRPDRRGRLPIPVKLQPR